MVVAEVEAGHGELGVACGAVGDDFFGGDGDGACVADGFPVTDDVDVVPVPVTGDVVVPVVVPVPPPPRILSSFFN